MEIEILKANGDIPIDLLLLADPFLDMIQKYEKTGRIYLVKFSNKVIGVIVISEINNDTDEVMNVAIKEEFQNKGIGKQLIQFAINKSKSNGKKKLEICTGNSSITQLAMYQKLGFRMIGIELDFFTNKYKDKIIENGIEFRDKIRLQMVLD